jgi:hypothetical protein
MRFEQENSTTKKILDKFEFPIDETLDMYDYSVEKLNYEKGIISSKDIIKRNRNYYKYKLAGIIIHVGESTSVGHYFSFIREREYIGNKETKFGEWLEFDDGKVKKIDLNYVKENSFGGIIENENLARDIGAENYRRFVEQGGLYKQKTAYGLIYERIIPEEYSEIKNNKIFEFMSVNSLYTLSKKSNFEIISKNILSEETFTFL